MFKKENIKLITLDFDGTSLQKDQTWLSPRNMHALKLAQQKGITIVPCTGRTEDMFPPQIEKDLSFRYWLTCCGARVVDRLTKEVIYKETFTPEQSAQVCKLFEGRHIYAEIAAEGRLFFENDVLQELYKYPVPSHHVWYLDTGRQIPVYGKLSDFFLNQNIGIEKFNLYGVPEDFQQELASKIKALGFVEFKDGSLTDMQFLCKTTDRIKAITSILDRLGYTFDNVMSIGDSLGMDGDMIERAALGVTLENASDELKKKADYVTDHYLNDGLAKAIEKLLL